MELQTDQIEIATATATRDEARAIARDAVERHLCACAHIDEIESFYRWEGAVYNRTEYRVTLQSVEDRFYDIQRLIYDHHSYIEPAIHVRPVSGGSTNYLNWVSDNS
jgi:periplasmic divalent cation tolerance protein